MNNQTVDLICFEIMCIILNAIWRQHNPIPMNNQTVDQDQLNNCQFNGGYSCVCISDHSHKKLCKIILTFCVFMIAAALYRTLIYIIDKTRHLCDDPTVAEAEELELEIEAKPDPLSDLSENLNKINICH